MGKWITPLVSLLFCSSVVFANTLINGAGATFPYPIYNNWFSTYSKNNEGIRINYQSIGSGGGIRQLLAGTVDFGASDAPMTEEELKKAKTPILHIPTVLGAVVLSYNLDLGTDKPLRLTGELIVDIFMGKIKKWNDPQIAKLNPDAKLPDRAIVVVHRSDGSGTTSVFAEYLAKVSKEWKEKVGVGKSLRWPTGVGGKGNEGVAGVLRQAPGTIGYIELVYAVTNKLPFAEIKNPAGNFVKASPESISNSAAGNIKSMIENNFQQSITNSSAQNAYPISAFTYLLVPSEMPTEKGKPLVSFLNWALGDEGQKIAADMNYAPLPKELRSAVLKTVNELKFAK